MRRNALKLILTVCALFVLWSAAAYAEGETVTLYSTDGRMATIPAGEKDAWTAVGWSEDFPYYGSEFWVKDIYLENYTTDIYGTKTLSPGSMASTYTKIKVEWYDGESAVPINEYEKRIGLLIFDIGGAKYKMPYSDLLRGRSPYASYTQIYWGSPQNMYGIAAQSWTDIQKGYIWEGMPQNEFLLVVGPKTNDIYWEGNVEKWVYWDAAGNSYTYDFIGGALANLY